MRDAVALRSAIGLAGQYAGTTILLTTQYWRKLTGSPTGSEALA